MLGAIGNRTAQWPAAFFSVSVESIRKILPRIPTYTPIWSATSSDKPFSFTISFFTSSHGSYDGMTEWAERSPGFKINPYEHCSVSTHLVEFIHCWTDGAELVIWNATYSKHPIKNTSIIDLEENKKLLNYWFKGIVKNFLKNSRRIDVEKPWSESHQCPARLGFHGQSSDTQHLESWHHTVLLCQNPVRHTNVIIDQQLEFSHRMAFRIRQCSVSIKVAGATSAFRDNLRIGKTLCNVHGSWPGCHADTLWQCGSVLCWLSCSWLNTGRKAPGKTGEGWDGALFWKMGLLNKICTGICNIVFCCCCCWPRHSVHVRMMSNKQWRSLTLTLILQLIKCHFVSDFAATLT